MAPSAFVGESLWSLGWPPIYNSASPSWALGLQACTTMSGFENLCVFKADHLDIGEFLHWFLQTGNISPRKRHPFSIPKLPIWVGSQAPWIQQTPCHRPPHLKFLSIIGSPQLPAKQCSTQWPPPSPLQSCQHRSKGPWWLLPQAVSRFLRPCISAPLHRDFPNSSRHSNPMPAFRLRWRPSVAVNLTSLCPHKG